MPGAGRVDAKQPRSIEAHRRGDSVGEMAGLGDRSLGHESFSGSEREGRVGRDRSAARRPGAGLTLRRVVDELEVGEDQHGNPVMAGEELEVAGHSGARHLAFGDEHDKPGAHAALVGRQSRPGEGSQSGLGVPPPRRDARARFALFAWRGPE